MTIRIFVSPDRSVDKSTKKIDILLGEKTDYRVKNLISGSPDFSAVVGIGISFPSIDFVI